MRIEQTRISRLGAHLLGVPRGGVVIPERLMHAINLLLEIFGECLLLREDLAPASATSAPEKLLNWEVVSEGPTSDLSEPFAPVVSVLSPAERAVAQYRLRRIIELGPDFVAGGRGGYRGCGALGFGDRGRFVIESAYHDNATHVTSRNWDDLSRHAKSDLLAGLPGDRPIVHSRGWEARLRDAVDAGLNQG